MLVKVTVDGGLSGEFKCSFLAQTAFAAPSSFMLVWCVRVKIIVFLLINVNLPLLLNKRV